VFKHMLIRALSYQVSGSNSLFGICVSLEYNMGDVVYSFIVCSNQKKLKSSIMLLKNELKISCMEVLVDVLRLCPAVCQ
jgi:hypothetical protein